MAESVKLHLGCGPNIKPGYTNVDAWVDHPEVVKADILDLPWDADSVDEILSEHVFEHIEFEQEERLWRGCFRVLKPGGRLVYSTCSIEPEENQLQVQRLLRKNPELRLDFIQEYCPDNKSDGGFQALLVK